MPRFRLFAGLGSALITLSLLLVPTPGLADVAAVEPRPAVTTGDPRFGIVQAIHSPDMALRAGATWERIIFPWNKMQPRPGALEPGLFSDQQLRDQVARGFTEVGVITYTPTWAAPDPRTALAKTVPRNVYHAWDDPDNYWGQFTGQLAARYKGLVDNWIIWNEPDLYEPGSRWFFDGSFEDYYQMLKVAYQAIKANNPKARVILAGMAYWYDKWYDRPPYLASLIEVAARDPSARKNNWYFDAVAVHTYTNPLNSYTIPLTMRRILQERGIDKPIWIVESNAVPDDDSRISTNPGPYRVTQAEQASYVIQSYALGIAAGVERQGIYKMLDETPEDGQYFGLVRNDGSIRPAYVAYQVAATYLSDARWAAYYWGDGSGYPSDEAIDALLASNRDRPQWIWPDAVNRVVVERGDVRTTVVWNASPRPVRARVPAAAAWAEAVTQEGSDGQVIAEHGAYTLDLPPATNNSEPSDRSIYLVGGRPWILEEHVAPLPERVRARIEMVWPHDWAPVDEAKEANVTVQLLDGKGAEPVPCRWEPRVTLWRSMDGGPDELAGLGHRELMKRDRVTYPVWQFDNVDVRPARSGKTLTFSVKVDGIKSTSEYWTYGTPPPPPEPTPTPTAQVGAAPTPESEPTPPVPSVVRADPPATSCR